MFRKMTPFEHHKSIMPFDYLFMTKEQYEQFEKKTQPGDFVASVTITTNDDKQPVLRQSPIRPYGAIPDIGKLSLENN